MRSAGRGNNWIVLLEAADGPGRPTIDPSELVRLVTALGPPAPTTLFSPDRYALQMPVRAADAASALAVAVARWRQALDRCGLPERELVRAEILTPAELESELEQAERAGAGPPLDAAPPPVAANLDPLEEDLLRRALFDPVTGLPSRELFLEEVRRALALGAAGPSLQAVVALHVDLAMHHRPDDPPSDDVLAEVARRLTASVRAGDTVARVGSTDFAVLIEVRAADDTDLLAHRLLQRLRWPQMAPSPEPVTTVGVAMAQRGGDADDLLQMAGLAMVAAGRPAGGPRLRRYADGSQPRRMPHLAGDAHDGTA